MEIIDEFIEKLKNIDLNLEGDTDKPLYSTEMGMLKGLLDEVEKLKERIKILEDRK